MFMTVKRRAWPILLTLHLLAAVVVAVQRLVSGAQINNFLIFRSAFGHLLRGQNLYAAYPAEHFDLYKYSPTFALLFAPFAVLPLGAALVGWNLLNALVLCFAVRAVVPAPQAAAVLAVCFLEAVGSMQNVQSNSLVAGLMILTLAATEQRAAPTGALAAGAGAAVKIFPAAAGLFGLLGERPWRFVGWSALVGAVLVLLPLVVTSPASLGAQYRWWGELQALDRLRNPQMWIGGLLQQQQVPIRGEAVQVVGLAALLGAAWLARSVWHDVAVRRLLLALLLVFSNIFNHNAESPSYVIGFAGLGIWWVSMPSARWRDAVLAGAVVMGSLVASDLTTKAFRAAYLVEWKGKAIVMAIVWGVLLAELWRRRVEVSRGAAPTGA